MGYWGYSGGSGRYIGLMNKKDFISGVARLDRASKNWVAERTGETGNQEEIASMNRNPGDIIRLGTLADRDEGSGLTR